LISKIKSFFSNPRGSTKSIINDKEVNTSKNISPTIHDASDNDTELVDKAPSREDLREQIAKAYAERVLQDIERQKALKLKKEEKFQAAKRYAQNKLKEIEAKVNSRSFGKSKPAPVIPENIASSFSKANQVNVIRSYGKTKSAPFIPASPVSTIYPAHSPYKSSFVEQSYLDTLSSKAMNKNTSESLPLSIAEEVIEVPVKLDILSTIAIPSTTTEMVGTTLSDQSSLIGEESAIAPNQTVIEVESDPVESEPIVTTLPTESQSLPPIAPSLTNDKNYDEPTASTSTPLASDSALTDHLNIVAHSSIDTFPIGVIDSNNDKNGIVDAEVVIDISTFSLSTDTPLTVPISDDLIQDEADQVVIPDIQSDSDSETVDQATLTTQSIASSSSLNEVDFTAVVSLQDTTSQTAYDLDDVEVEEEEEDVAVSTMLGMETDIDLLALSEDDDVSGKMMYIEDDGSSSSSSTSSNLLADLSDSIINTPNDILPEAVEVGGGSSSKIITTTTPITAEPVRWTPNALLLSDSTFESLLNTNN